MGLKKSFLILAIFAGFNSFGQVVKQLNKSQVAKIESRMVDAPSTEKLADSLHLAYLIEHYYFETKDDAMSRLELYYRKAIEFNPSCTSCALKAENLSKGNHSHLEPESYDKLIAAADLKFNSGEYEAAKEIYSRALSIKPTDAYAADRIATIDSLLYSEKSHKKKKSKGVTINKNLENQNTEPEQKL